jgi:hypothetical protein
MKNEMVTKEMGDQFNSRSVVKKLENLMDKVTEKNCTVETVNAACNCAGRITDLLRLHLEVERIKIRKLT